MTQEANQRALWALSVLLALGLGALGAIYLPRDPDGPPPITSIEAMSHLVSVKVRYADVITFTQQRTFNIPWTAWNVIYAGTRVVFIARGDCLVATDLAQAKYELVDTKSRTLVLSLPPPSVLSPRVIFAPRGQWGSEIYAVSNQGVAAIIPGDASRKRAIDGAIRLAQKRVEEAGRARDVTEAAKANAEQVLHGVFDALGWKASFRWR